MKLLRKISYFVLALVLCSSALLLTACNNKEGKYSDKEFEKLSQHEKINYAQELMDEMEFESEKNWALNVQMKQTMVNYEFSDGGFDPSTGMGTINSTYTGQNVMENNVKVLLNLESLKKLNEASLQSLSGMKLDLTANMSDKTYDAEGKEVASDTMEGFLYIREANDNLDIWVSTDENSKLFNKMTYKTSTLLDELGTSASMPEITPAMESAVEQLITFMDNNKMGYKFMLDKGTTITQEKNVVNITFDYAKFVNSLITDVQNVVSTIKTGTIVNDLLNNETVKAYFEGIFADATAKELYEEVLAFVTVFEPTVAPQVEAMVATFGAPAEGESVYDYAKKVVANYVLDNGVILGSMVIPATTEDLFSINLALGQTKEMLKNYVCQYTLKVKNNKFVGLACNVSIKVPSSIVNKNNETTLTLEMGESSDTFADISNLALAA